MKTLLSLLTLVFVTLNTTITHAAMLEAPYTYEPGFLCMTGLTSDEVILSEDKTQVIGVKDEVLTTKSLPEEMKLVATPSDAVVEEVEPVVETAAATQTGNRWGITLNQYEKDMLAKIVVLEAGNQGDVGQQAVVEVIFNRVTSKNFPNDVMSVLSQKGQFTTWKFVNKGRPTAREYANIEAVLNGQTNILPAKTVFFSRGAQNSRVQARIEDHVFCNER